MGVSAFIIIPTEWYYDPGSHPLVGGNPPKWADGWGDSGKYGPFVEIGAHCFIWLPSSSRSMPGFWFCQVEQLDQDTLSSLREIGGIDATEPQVKRILEYSGYKNRLLELESHARYRHDCAESDRALMADMRANPANYPTIEEAQQRSFRKR